MTTLSAPAPGPTRRRAVWRRALVGWAFLAPLLVLNVLVVLGPSIATVYYSFTDWSGIGPANLIGLDNYTRAFTDPAVHEALLHNAIWFVLFLSVPMALGMLGAHLINQVRRFRMVFRTLFFIPYVTASVINAAIWKMLLSPNSGIAAQLGFDQAWLGDPATSLYAVNFVVDWHWWGFLAVIFFAAMQNVDVQLYEAAKLDGAGRWQQFKSVTLPGIRPTLVFIVLMTVIWSLKAFDYIFIMTHGGPANSSDVVSTLMYDQAFNQYSAGYAAALGLSMTAVTGLVLAAYAWLRRKGWEE
ncbi:carbohydrate ABC transporter permease [Dactylosporangium sp. CA-139114]|uniref:carbohydrate ABC transporter permease n=1 Tax=Dactylosporangium sp. CA-139114 TaxID=3239931 RepID=UPI003D956E71